MKIKIEKKLFNWRVKFKRKTNLVKWQKKKIQKNADWNDLKNKTILSLKGEIEKNNKFYKILKKIRNQNNENQTGKHITIHLNWRMKLKSLKLL